MAAQKDFTQAPIGSFAPNPSQSLAMGAIRRFGLGNGALRKYGGKLLERLREGPIDCEYFGLTIRLVPPFLGNARHMLLTPRQSEQRERAFVEAHVPEGGVFLDIGANLGSYTFFAASRVPGATVLSFEPLARYAHMLRFNADANGLSRILIEEVAVSDRQGTVEFSAESESMVFGAGSVEVRTAPLLDVLKARGIESIDCMKVDVEGVEDRVLMPFFRSADRAMWPKAILIEHVFQDTWRDDCIAFAKANGYREVFRTKLNAALALTA